MTSINLLPRRSAGERVARHVLVLLAVSGVLAAVLQLAIGTGLSSGVLQMEAEIRLLDTELNGLRKQLAVDPKTDLVLAAKDQLASFLRDRKDWMMPLAFTLGHLPDDAEIISMGSGETGNISADFRFASAADALRYLMQLDAVPMFREVTIREWNYAPAEHPIEIDAAMAAVAERLEIELPDGATIGTASDGEVRVKVEWTVLFDGESGNP
jgi:Tfp pilus assembly protein PilN